ncbi:unnamed protein product, partial [Brugia timori]|uniref:Uncharacterized protein n=1 Tax=Brugia timori TaxID=42155 RepID=A0A0R3Q9E0_9BILA
MNRRKFMSRKNIHHQIRQQMRDMERMTHGMLNPFG